jgi:hypothetical protein
LNLRRIEESFINGLFNYISVINMFKKEDLVAWEKELLGDLHKSDCPVHYNPPEASDKWEDFEGEIPDFLKEHERGSCPNYPQYKHFGSSLQTLARHKVRAALGPAFSRLPGEGMSRKLRELSERFGLIPGSVHDETGAVIEYMRVIEEGLEDRKWRLYRMRKDAIDAQRAEYRRVALDDEHVQERLTELNGELAQYRHPQEGVSEGGPVQYAGRIEG